MKPTISPPNQKATPSAAQPGERPLPRAISASFFLAGLLGVDGFPAYGVALGVAGVGILVAYLVVQNLPQVATV